MIFEAFRVVNGKDKTLAADVVGALLVVDRVGASGQLVAGQAFISSEIGVLNKCQGTLVHPELFVVPQAP